MKILRVLAGCLVVIFANLSLGGRAMAEEINLSAGSLLLQGSKYVSVGYRVDQFDYELMVMDHGKEEPSTKPGPEYCFNVLAFLPSYPVFLKAGLVTGRHQKNGFNLGAGVDFPLDRHWAIRLQGVRSWAKEDFGEEREAENLLSVGVKFTF